MQCRGSGGGCQLPQGSASCLLLSLSRASSLAAAVPSLTSSSRGKAFFVPRVRCRGKSQEVWSWPLPTSPDGPCGLIEGDISLVIESLVKNVDGPVTGDRAQLLRLPTLGFRRLSSGTPDPRPLLALNVGLGWVSSNPGSSSCSLASRGLDEVCRQVEPLFGTKGAFLHPSSALKGPDSFLDESSNALWVSVVT